MRYISGNVFLHRFEYGNTEGTLKKIYVYDRLVYKKKRSNDWMRKTFSLVGQLALVDLALKYTMISTLVIDAV